jgi:F1F0 ATPase subunit 2
VNVSDWLWLGLALVVGSGLGLFYFGGLWITIQRLPHSKNPALLSFISFLVRTIAVLLIFYFLMDGRVERLAVAMLGFIIARQILFRRLARQSAALEPTKGR